MRPTPPPPVHPQQPQLRYGMLVLLVVVVVIIGYILGSVVTRMLTPAAPTAPTSEPTSVTEPDRETRGRDLTHYGPKEEQPGETLTPAPATPGAPSGKGGTWTPPRLTTPPPLTPPPRQAPAPQQAPLRLAPQQAAPAPPRPVGTWGWGTIVPAKAPIPAEDEVPGTTGAQQRQARQAEAQKLLPQANWVMPTHPERVLYAQQVMNGVMMHEVNSDKPGPVRMRITEDVVSRFGDGHVLIPAYSVMIGEQDGRPVYGDDVLGVNVTRIEMRDGEILALNKAKGGDVGGATGIPGDVDNHYVQLGVLVLVQTALQLGPKIAAGSPQGFQPSVQQDIAQDVANSMSRTGQQIMQQRMPKGPTIRLHQNEPVTVWPSEAVSLQTDPIEVAR